MAHTPVFPTRRSNYRKNLPSHVQPPPFMTPTEIREAVLMFNDGVPWSIAVKKTIAESPQSAAHIPSVRSAAKGV